jgi:hypothetical protein
VGYNKHGNVGGGVTAKGILDNELTSFRYVLLPVKNSSFMRSLCEVNKFSTHWAGHFILAGCPSSWVISESGRVFEVNVIILFLWFDSPSGPGPPHFRGFAIAVRHTTLGRTPLNGWSAQRIDLYLTTPNTYKKHTSMLQARFEPAIPAPERTQTHALDRATRGIGHVTMWQAKLLILERGK